MKAIEELVLQHLETALGPLAQGFTCALASETGQRVDILQFTNQPVTGVDAYISFGLARHDLALRTSIELMILLKSTNEAETALRAMSDVSGRILAKHSGPLRGDVFKDVDGLGRTMTPHLYCTQPSYGMELLITNGPPALVLIMLVPITESERLALRSSGWNWFECLLENEDPDITDFQRAAIV